MLAELYQRVGPRLYRYALAVLGDPGEAEDAVQDVFTRMAESGIRPQHPEHYLLRAVRNEALGRSRQDRRRQTLLQEGAPVLLPREAGDAALTGFAARVSAALAGLPVEQREVVALHLFEEMSFREIAEATDVTQDTAASRYRYGIEKLREILADERP